MQPEGRIVSLFRNGEISQPKPSCIDTNTLPELIKDPHGRVARRVLDAGVDNVCTSIIAASRAAVRRAQGRSARLRRRAEELLAEIQVLPFGEPAGSE